MAKKTNGATTATTEPTPVQLTKATQKLIDGVREQFTGYLSGYNALQTTRAKLAGPFMRAFNAWAGETGGSFVAFVRLFDATVGMKTEEYRNHPTYQAAEYLKRKARDIAAAQEARAAVQAGGEPAEGAGVGAEAPATPLDALARFVAMVVPLIAHEDQGKIWEFFASDFGWSERRINTLRELVEQAKPFATIRTERGQPRPQLHLVHARTAGARTGTTG